MTRPTNDQLATIRVGAKTDLDRILDSWPTIIDAAATHYRPNQHNEQQAIGRQGGTHSDPTGSQAFKANPAAQWQRDAIRALDALQALAARIDDIIGEARCPHCDEPLAGRKIHRIGAIAYHDGACYSAAYRARRAA